MGLLFDGALVDILVLVAVLITVAYLYATRNFNYWRDRGVPFIKPTAFIGNCKDLLLVRRTAGHFIADLYNKAPGVPYVGYFILDRPALVVRDPNIIKNILVKDFNYFADRFITNDENVDPLGAKNLFLRRGKSWKHLRSKLTPTFSSGKMKNMFHLVNKCFVQLTSYLDDVDFRKDVEIKELLGCCTTDVISSCAFGIDSNCLTDKNAEFREMGRKNFDYNFTRGAEATVLFFVPSIVKIIKLSFFQRDTAKFLRKLFWEMVDHREKSKTSRNDLIDLLIQIKNKGSIDDPENHKIEENQEKNDIKFDFDGDDLAAQAAIFFTAGFETTASAMSFTLYELALQPDIQRKVRKEMVATLEEHKGEISYEAVHSMKYLDMILSETLRKYPPLPFLDRQCLEDYKIPGTNFTIEKDTPVYIPAIALHYNPEYFPNPENYDPEHFSEERKKTRPPCTYLPFGEGPRNCIGMRFGLMTAKTGLVHILSQYEVQPCKETPIPLVINNSAVLITTIGGIPLSFKPVT